ncbi:PTS glucitol/sorbitol transporter subunit IIA [Liquorilactobacillus mali]|uniref:PTS system, glucitol sorbitol-specific IIA component n=1 Tax=Liquorilactobacillus mali KCTC 3596 = DSM 20444 TaxID=1046596 RepID=J1F4S9_9LACO|nr:PTS glucitol/sorbitol transporter subunit IIA [Liquorilactobacillus mali]EJF00916.1 PTS system, glucitol/sorbitol-specific IIA component [Liquorilactobacillus mali KCTC 3596 = DSM 20444]KRN11513.1 PTS system, glucitol sorbitol-specific IIA component [Liquorilactobacillus mali KCTC 3596 = DSM 20444]MDC7952388.1 PTS glucitol/sorbitol transporter subunit IIA [Liquorilactobacillus mali]MDV7756757.1 PTS glucose transporter subunit IIA [Liquorilactobacillus mali]QFQ74262.1 PTS glucose transporter
MLEAKVVEIGPEAISKNDPLMILFDETASVQLRRVSVVQHFINSDIKKRDIKSLKNIQIDDQVYEIKHIGELVQSNMEMIGHATLFFAPVPENPQHSGIYLEPYELPNISVGSVIKYY